MMTSFQQQRLMMNQTGKAPQPPQSISAPPPLLPPGLPPSSLPSNLPLPPMLPPGLPMAIPPPPMSLMPMNSIPMESTPSASLPIDTEDLMDELDPKTEEFDNIEEPPAPGTEETEMQVDPANVPE